jgi:hypothetical protein
MLDSRLRKLTGWTSGTCPVEDDPEPPDLKVPIRHLDALRRAWSRGNAADILDQARGLPEPLFPDLRTQFICPGLLRNRDGPQDLAPLRRRMEQLRPTVTRVGCVQHEAFTLEKIGDALNRLPGDTTPSCDLGDRRWPVLDGVQDQPTGERLSAQSGERLTLRREYPTEPRNLKDELSKGIAGR